MKCSRRTGSQVLPVNTVYQLFSAGKEDPSAIATSQHALMIADAVNYYLTGTVGGDLTLAHTSGLLSLDGKWDRSICSNAGIPLGLLPPLKQPGTVRGRLHGALQLELQLPSRIPVISVAAHDTASAVCGLPLRTQEAFLICGSWSIIGHEVVQAIASEDARLSGFGNEGGVEGRSLFLRSLNGLHLLQKLRAHWSERVGQEISFTQMSIFDDRRHTRSVCFNQSVGSSFLRSTRHCCGLETRLPQNSLHTLLTTSAFSHLPSTAG
ncbi:hypothetical protein LP421_04075 (plasmid) [Rhizobium sp. RCAM05350]|nr:hypothetical protein LP421_04075 [Rhizobium sp. RCAM05350]